MTLVFIVLIFVGLLAGYVSLAVVLFRRRHWIGWSFLASTLMIWLAVALSSHIGSPSSIALGVVVLPGAFVGTTIFLFLWRRWAGLSLLGCTAMVSLICYANMNVIRHQDELMKYRVVAREGESDVEVITSRGERFQVGSAVLAARLRGASNDTVRVSMNQTFDFGRMRSYEILRVEGVDPYAP
jgi:hypothetical protein